VQEGQRLGGLGEVRKDARQGESGSALGPQQSREVGAIDPIHHDDVLVVVEEVLSDERQRRMRRQPEQDPGLAEKIIAAPIRSDRSDLQSHRASVLVIERLHHPRLAAGA